MVTQDDSAKRLAQHVQATLMRPVAQLLAPDYPLRCPPAADAAEAPGGFKLDEVSVTLKVLCSCTGWHRCKSSIVPC